MVGMLIGAKLAITPTINGDELPKIAAVLTLHEEWRVIRTA
jgi:hypothetical protein